MRASKPKSLRWLQAAREDLFEIADYIALDSNDPPPCPRRRMMAASGPSNTVRGKR
jgi:hypothetical protein